MRVLVALVALSYAAVVAASTSSTALLGLISGSLSGAGGGASCKDGLCKAPTPSESNSNAVAELNKLGWSDAEAERALAACGNAVAEAAALLESEQEAAEAVDNAVRRLYDAGWDRSVAFLAANFTGGNVTAAAEMLDAEEREVITTFQSSVHMLMDEQWDEIVARQALLSQFSLNQRRARGENVTYSREVLDKIRPTLRRPTTPTPAAPARSAAPQTTKKVKREEVIFDVTAQTLQALVLESPVPVLLDVHAEWCGPCKQLGPMLEDITMRAGGLFRLAKVDGDKEPTVKEALGVRAYPTVFAASHGRITDRFVGLLPPEQLQAFLKRMATGTGARVQAHEFSAADAADATGRLQLAAGLGALGSADRQRMLATVDQALALPDAFSTSTAGKPSLASGPATALAYLRNAQADLWNATVRSIPTGSRAFQTRIADCRSARMLLEAAGFERHDRLAALHLCHHNAARLQLVVQRVEATVAERRFAKMKTSPAPPSRLRATQATVAKEEVAAPTAVVATTKAPSQRDEVVLGIRLADATQTQRAFAAGTSLRAAWQALCDGTTAGGSVTLRFPPPHRDLPADSPLWRQTLREVAAGGVSVGLNVGMPDVPTRPSAAKKRLRALPSKWRKTKPTAKPPKKQPVEYFGGDSTVFLSADEGEGAAGEGK